MMIKRSTLLILLILASGLTFIITGRIVFRFHYQSEKHTHICEIADLLRIAEPLHTGDYDEAKRKLCGLLLRHAWDIGKLKQSSYFGERKEANRSLVRIGSFYESNGGYLDCYYIVDAPKYIEEARIELNERDDLKPEHTR